MIFFQCVLILVFFCCPQRQPDSPLLSPLSSIHPMYSPMFHITSIQMQVCSLCTSSCFRRMLWLLLCPMHVSMCVCTRTHCSPYPRNHIRPPVPQSFIMFYSGNPFESRITEKRSLLQTILHLGPFWIQCSPKSPLDWLHLLLCFVLWNSMTVCTIIVLYCM